MGSFPETSMIQNFIYYDYWNSLHIPFQNVLILVLNIQSIFPVIPLLFSSQSGPALGRGLYTDAPAWFWHRHSWNLPTITREHLTKTSVSLLQTTEYSERF